MGVNKKRTKTTSSDLALGRPDRLASSWTTARVETLVVSWNAGRSAADIAKQLAVSPRAVESKLHKLRAAGRDLVRRRAGPAKPAGRARRRCLHCGEMFASDHPGNRLCPVCLDEGPFTSALV